MVEVGLLRHNSMICQDYSKYVFAVKTIERKQAIHSK